LLFGSFQIKRKVSEVPRVLVLQGRKYQSIHPEAYDVFLTIHKRGVFEMHPIATSYSKQKLCSGEFSWEKSKRGIAVSLKGLK
jgi:hypothetical protein